jgi:hypothetical protein
MSTHHSLNRSHRRSSRSQMFIAMARTNLLMVDGGRHRSGDCCGHQRHVPSTAAGQHLAIPRSIMRLIASGRLGGGAGCSAIQAFGAAIAGGTVFHFPTEISPNMHAEGAEYTCQNIENRHYCNPT